MSEQVMQTRGEFESQYNGGDTKALIIAGGLSLECRCDYETCGGWKMTRLSHLDEDVVLYGNTPEEVTAAITHRSDLLAQYELEEKRNGLQA